MTYEERLQTVIAAQRARWIRLLTSGELGVTADMSFALLTFEVIQRYYTANVRYYHTLFHLERMFMEFDKVRAKLTHPALVEFAIFLHDII